MTPTRIFLGLSILLWLPYGIYCFFQPHALGEAAGVTAVSATAVTELRAMYGGLQAAIGALALGGLVRADLERPALLMLLFLGAGLFVSRLAGAALDDSFTGYTLGALGFELASSAAAATLLRRAQPATI
jgi:hypothetical protein